MDRVKKAVENFKNGYNCSQAVVGAYCELFGLKQEDGLRAAEAFGGGMGRLRLTCGAVSGMFMLAGLRYSEGKAKDLQTRQKVYAMVQLLAKEFEQKNGSIICADLLGMACPKDTGAVPTKRDAAFYQKRPCVGCIEDCARLVETYLL